MRSGGASRGNAKPSGEPVPEGYCSVEEEHNNNNNKNMRDTSWIFLYDRTENNQAGGIRCFEDTGGSSPSAMANDLFTPHAKTRSGKKNHTQCDLLTKISIEHVLSIQADYNGLWPFSTKLMIIDKGYAEHKRQTFTAAHRNLNTKTRVNC